MLPIIVVFIVIIYVEFLMFRNLEITSDWFLLLHLFLIWPLLAVHAKRWHDLDKSGWWTLTFFIPILNIWHAFVNWFSKGTEGRNRFGPEK